MIRDGQARMPLKSSCPAKGVVGWKIVEETRGTIDTADQVILLERKPDVRFSHPETFMFIPMKEEVNKPDIQTRVLPSHAPYPSLLCLRGIKVRR